jgi:hypothetical protein
MRYTLALAVVLAACSSGDDDPGTSTDPVLPGSCEVELGGGVREWQAVDDGDTVYLYRGPQGGWMIYLSVRARGMDPSDVSVAYVESFSDTGEAFGQDEWRVQLQNDVGDGWFERVGIWGAVFDDYWTSSYLIRGKDARIDVTVTDNTTGCQAEDGWSVHIHEDPGS